MTDQVWMELSDGVSIGVDRDKALSMDRKGFVELYRGSVYRGSRRDAERFADEQLALRAAYLGTATAQGEAVRVEVGALKRALLAPFVPLVRWLAGR